MATKQRAALVTPPAETAAKSKKAGFTIPKTLAACADLLYSTKQERLALGKQVAELEARESALREHLIDNLPKSDALGVTGKLARATIEDKDIVLMEDWPAFYKYLVKEYAKNPAVFALMQRRVNDATIKEMWGAKKKVPGTALGKVKVVSLNKL